MSDEPALLQAIFADPADDLPRLAYADWLAENAGRAGAARGEFIQVQVELGRPPRDRARALFLQQRQQALWQEHGKHWWQDVSAGLRGGVIFRRGFIDEYRGTARSFFQEDPGRFWQVAPAQVLGLSGATVPFLGRLAGAAPLARLTRLEWSTGPADLSALEALARSPHLTRLVSLALTRVNLDAGLLEVLLEAPWLSRLRSLSLSRNELGDPGAARLAREPTLAGLRELDLSANSIGGTGGRALVDSPYLGNLQTLGVDWNFLDEETLGLLRRRFGRCLRPGRQVL